MLAERELLGEVVDRLADVGVPARLRDTPGEPDLVIRAADGDHVFAIEVKQAITSASAGAVAAQLARHGAHALLFTDYVNAALAERLRDSGVHFADAAGNMYLSAPGLLVWVTGRRPSPDHQVPRRSSRAFSANGLRAAFCLLADPTLAAQPYRNIAEVAGISLGSVQSVMHDLVERGHLADGKARRLLRPDRLLDQWAEFYADGLRPKLELGRFRASYAGWWRAVPVRDYAVLWGGETAGALMTGQLRPEITTVYAATVPHQLLIDQRLRRDVDGDVELRHLFWKDLPAPRSDVVPAPLVYADLLANGDARSLEIAGLVRERYLD